MSIPVLILTAAVVGAVVGGAALFVVMMVCTFNALSKGF